MKALLIEDDHGIATALSQALSDYDVDAAFCGEDGLNKVTCTNYDVVLLDLNLPDMPGLEVCRHIRRTSSTVPIIILSCEVHVISKITLLEAGADDYLTKPFSLGELKVRLRVQTRRAMARSYNSGRMLVDDLELDCDKHLVERGGNSIRLRRKEFALLECLMQQAGTVVTRQELRTYAWRKEEEPWDNTVDVHIKYLRDKIDRPFSNQLIKTVHGLGYKLETKNSSGTLNNGMAR